MHTGGPQLVLIFGWLLVFFCSGSNGAADPVAASKEDASIAPMLTNRELSQFQLSDIVLLSTLEGSLQARNRENGNLLWSIKGASLVDVRQKAGNRAKPSTNNNTTMGVKWLAEPSEQGALYFFTPKTGLERIPAPVLDLIQKAPFGMVENVVYTGSRHTTLYAIDIVTGEVLQAFGSVVDFESPAAATIDRSRVLMIGMTECILDIHEQLGAPGSRISIRSWTPNLRDQDLARQYTAPLDSLYVTTRAPTTVLALADSEKWIQDVGGLMVDVFDVLLSDSDRSIAVVQQPVLKVPRSSAEWDLYVDANASAVLSGPRFSALYEFMPRATYCDGTGTDISGVHPMWCQDKRRIEQDKGGRLGPVVPAISLLPARPSAVPLLDPPAGFDEPVLLLPPAAEGVLVRVLETAGIVIVLFGVVYAMFAKGWIPMPRPTRSTMGKVEEGNHEDKVNGEEEEPKKRKRGARGGRRGPKDTIDVEPPIVVSEHVLGYGSHGTTVFKGRFENRDVAVKRMLLEFYDVASQEVDIMRESDDHPNVVRYYYKYQTDQFLYIALELCPCTLEGLVRDASKFSMVFSPLDALRQVTLGLQHLHSLQIVHRDIKPQNILVALPNRKTKRGRGVHTIGVRYVISDFGLCRKLEGEQSSFVPTVAADSVAGTAGWAAPEILDMGSADSFVGPTSEPATTQRSESSTESGTTKPKRLTRAVDIFSMGCLFYYVLSGGKHPFGDPHMRQVNIQQRRPPTLLAGNLVTPEALNLIPQMLDVDPSKRPNTQRILAHPMFWPDQMKLDFLVRVSDRFEHESRDQTPLVAALEENATKVVGKDWHARFPSLFINDLGKYRRYHGDRLHDLLRALRNKLHHYNDLSPQLKQEIGGVPSGYLTFYTSRFPQLIMTAYDFVQSHLKDEDAFVSFFSPQV